MEAGGGPGSDGPGRITFRRIFLDVWHRVVEFDLPALRTVWELTLRPHRVIVPYIAGDRGRWTNPVQLYLVAGAVAVLAMKLSFPQVVDQLQTEIAASVEQRQAGGVPVAASGPGVAGERAGAVLEWYLEWSVLLGVLSSPLMALPNRVLFRSRGYNLAEHTVFVLYASIPAVLGSVAVAPLYLVSIEVPQLMSLGVMLIVLAHAARRVFGGNPLVVVLKTCVGQAFYLGLHMVALMAAMAIAVASAVLGA